MLSLNGTAKAGTLLCVDQGEYSDYGVLGFFAVVKDFEPAVELDEYLTNNPEQKDDYRFEYYEFLAALLNKGFLKELSYGTLYMGAYCEHNRAYFTPQSEEQ